MATTVRTLVWRGRDWNQSREEDPVKRNSKMEGIGRPMQRKTRSLNMLATVVTAGMIVALSGCASPTGYSAAHAAERQAPGPGAALTEADQRYLKQTVQKVLEVNEIGRGSNWLNPETGHGGTVIPTLTYKDKAGRDCREYQWSATVDGKVGFTHGVRCRQGKGVWTVAEAPEADPAPRATYSYRGDSYPYPYYSYRRSHYGYPRYRYAGRRYGYYPRGHRSYGYYYGGYHRYRH